jgi:hypothetical protein
MIDDFLAKSGINSCQSFKDTVDVVAKVKAIIIDSMDSKCI